MAPTILLYRGIVMRYLSCWFDLYREILKEGFLSLLLAPFLMFLIMLMYVVAVFHIIVRSVFRWVLTD